jgi:D-amino-acid oxidase
VAASPEELPGIHRTVCRSSNSILISMLSSLLTSQIAGALWEYPPAVCGSHTDELSLEYSKVWAMTSYRIWSAIARLPHRYGANTAGVRIRKSTFFFPELLKHSEGCQIGGQFEKMIKIKDCGVSGFRHDSALIKERGVAPNYGAKDAYEIDAPVIDTDVSTAWLMNLVKAKGAKLVTEMIHGDLLVQESSLCKRFGIDAIINATGLTAKYVANDRNIYPLRGALIRVHNEGANFPKVEAAMSISANVMPGHDGTERRGNPHDRTDNGIVFLVPRNDKTLIIGGIAQEGEWKLDLKLDSPSIQRMRKRAEAFLPGLKNAIVDADYPLAQGLRPARKGNVRVERELRRIPARSKSFSRIIHTYGHGGSGWSLNFGCAVDVCELVEEVLKEAVPQTMDERWRDRQQARKSITELICEIDREGERRSISKFGGDPKTMAKL